jgi:F-type H+-transporting ATPase subunit b
MIEMLSHEPFFFRWEVAIVQMAGFVLFFLVLKVLLFDRLLGFMRRRDEDLAAADRRIAGARQEVERLAAEYQAKLAVADKAAYEEMQKVVKEAIAAKASILSAAQEEGRRIVEAERRTVAAEKEEALRLLDDPVRALASDVADAATGGAASGRGLS